jgi:hypothetical protein
MGWKIYYLRLEKIADQGGPFSDRIGIFIIFNKIYIPDIEVKISGTR